MAGKPRGTGRPTAVREINEIMNETESSDTCTSNTERFNENSFRPQTLDYPQLRGGIIRRHNQVYHRFPEDTPAMAISADMDGVIP